MYIYGLRILDYSGMVIGKIRFTFFLFFFSFISLIADEPHHYHLACGHIGSSHLSPVHALQFFIAMQVQRSYNSSTNGCILLTHVPTLSVTKERTQILLCLVRIELTTSVLADVQLTY